MRATPLSAPLLLVQGTLPYCLFINSSLILYARIKVWHKCCRGLSQKLCFLFAFQNNPQNSLAIPNQKEKLAEAYNIILDTTKKCLIRRKRQEEIWGNSTRLLIALIQNLQSVLTLDHKKKKKSQVKLLVYKSCWHKAAPKTAGTYAKFVYSQITLQEVNIIPLSQYLLWTARNP